MKKTKYADFFLKWFGRIVFAVEVIYFLRFQLIGWFLLIGFPILAFSYLQTMFSGLFDLTDRNLSGELGPWSYLRFFFFSLLTFIFSWTVIITTKITLQYGPTRFELGQEAKDIVETITCYRHYHYVTFLIALFSTLPMLIAPTQISEITEIKQLLVPCGFMILGMAFFVLLLYLADRLQRLLNYPDDADKLHGFLFPFPKEWFIEANKSDKYIEPFGRFFKIPIFIIENTPEWFGKGYIRYEKEIGEKHTEIMKQTALPKKEPRKSVFVPELVLALLFFINFFILYLIIGWFGFRDVLSFGKFYPPALISVLLLFIFLVSLMSGVAFFFDRFRLPSVIFSVIIIFVFNLFSYLILQPVVSFIYNPEVQSAHVYKVEKGTFKLKSPAEFLQYEPRPPNFKKPFAIVVTADGGGIQAAAWAAKVLTGLERYCRNQIFNDPLYGGECSKKIRLISSVSGGSIGAMYFLNAYTEETGISINKSKLPECDQNEIDQEQDKRDNLDEIVYKAEYSSLDSVAWGFAFPDFFRVFGIPSKYSRGQILEEDWEKIDKCNELTNQNIAEWSNQLWRPSLIFNSTAVETGERLMISTSNFEKTKGSMTFQKLLKGYSNSSSHSIRISTAARLSSSFPFVTPTARADSRDCSMWGEETDKNKTGEAKIKSQEKVYPCLHIADGGYHDNYGVASMAEWLDEALLGKCPDDAILSNKCQIKEEDRVKDILIVQIRSSFISDTPHIKSLGDLFLQNYSPGVTLLNIRTAAQLANANSTVNFLMEKWNNKGQGYNIQTAVFEYQGETAPPLSWHLTRDEKTQIDENWEKILKYDKNDGLKIFREFLLSVK